MLYVVGSILLNSRERIKHLRDNLKSMEPIKDVLQWDFNIDGKYASKAEELIKSVWPNANITSDGQSTYYKVIKGQLDRAEQSVGENGSAFFWLEDHWFVCTEPQRANELFQNFQNGKADVLTISHLKTSWERKSLLGAQNTTPSFIEYEVSNKTQPQVWEKYPKAYVTGLPCVYRIGFAQKLLEFNKVDTDSEKRPHGYELTPSKAKQFFEEHGGFIEWVARFHVFREVFKRNKHARALEYKDAKSLLKFREKGLFS